MAITIKMIEDKEFPIAPMGYKRRDVDLFLDDICDEMERMTDEIQSLQMKLSQAGQGNTQIYQNGRGTTARPNVSMPAPLDIDAAPAREPVQAAPVQPVQQQPVQQPVQPVQAQAAPRQEPLRTDAASEATGLLRTAQRVYDETIRNAKEEARQILDNAQAQVDEQLKLQKQEREATEEALQSLRQSGLDYKKKFQALITGQQKLLDDAGDIFTEG